MRAMQGCGRVGDIPAPPSPWGAVCTSGSCDTAVGVGGLGRLRLEAQRCGHIHERVHRVVRWRTSSVPAERARIAHLGGKCSLQRLQNELELIISNGAIVDSGAVAAEGCTANTTDVEHLCEKTC